MRGTWTHSGPQLSTFISGGKILSDSLELVWTDGSPTDFQVWGKEERRSGCVALFSHLVLQHTRQAATGKYFDSHSLALKISHLTDISDISK